MITNALTAVFRRRRPALVCYLPVGDPGVPHADAALYLEEGVDVLEVGGPVDEPTLDGPVIASSMRRARANGADNETTAGAIAALRNRLGDPATVWMTYPSAAGQLGWTAAVERSGAHGTLVAGATPESFAVPPGVHRVGFLPHRPTTCRVAAMMPASGYVMVASDDGVTGVRAGVSADNRELLQRIRAAGVAVPLLLGFGIAEPDDARAAVACGADGIVVGTAVVTAAIESRGAVRRLLRGLRRALDE